MPSTREQDRTTLAQTVEPMAPHVDIRWAVPDQYRDDITQGWGADPAY
jgi:hypothetical protein